MEGLLHRTDYPSLDIIIVDNDSRERRTARLLHRMRTDPRVRVLPFPGPFNWSAMNNLAVRETPAEIVLLLNNDIDVIAPGWLAEMVQQAIRPDVGIVGAKLLYPDGSVQHAGIVLGPAGAAAHLMRHADRDDPGYQGQLVLPRTVSAVTGACMAMRRSVFLEVGGLEETELRVAYNDIDLCLRVREKGYRVVFAPGAELFHLEAASRGLDVSPEKQLRARQEREYMVRRWGPLVDRDPYLSPNLCVVNERLALASPPGSLPCARMSYDWASAVRQVAIRADTVRSQVNPAARASPAWRSLDASASSSIRRNNAVAIAPSSVGSTSSAASPAVSPVAVVSDATTGAPLAIASTIGSPNPS